jgi:hypothetical protein
VHRDWCGCYRPYFEFKDGQVAPDWLRNGDADNDCTSATPRLIMPRKREVR